VFRSIATPPVQLAPRAARNGSPGLALALFAATAAAPPALAGCHYVIGFEDTTQTSTTRPGPGQTPADATDSPAQGDADVSLDEGPDTGAEVSADADSTSDSAGEGSRDSPPDADVSEEPSDAIVEDAGVPEAAVDADAADAAGEEGTDAPADAAVEEASVEADAQSDGGAEDVSVDAGDAPLDADSASTDGDASTGRPSCDGLLDTCGGTADRSCCESAALPGGTFSRSYDGVWLLDTGYPATVGPFSMDVFEVTVGRFRRFVQAAPWKPAQGAGAHPKVPASGWDTSWNQLVPGTVQAWDTALLECQDYGPPTWTPVPGSDSAENRPVNCVTWYHALAFCAWDGGRLPSEAEWNFAAAAGSAQRVYPWSNPAQSSYIDPTYATYGFLAADASVQEIQVVGRKSPKGDGRWGHTDLAGNMSEWVLDAFRCRPDDAGLCGSAVTTTYATQNCVDCVETVVTTDGRTRRGGSWKSYKDDVRAGWREHFLPEAHGSYTGFRCAR
jgi:formylglycine-generating enzyme required for sulfatase activity